MAKEVKETQISMNLTYEGIATTVSQTVSNYELEEKMAALAKQVKLLDESGAALPLPE